MVRCGGDATSRSTVLSKLTSAGASVSCLRLDDTPSWKGDCNRRGATVAGLYPGPDPVIDDEVLDRDRWELPVPGPVPGAVGLGVAGVEAAMRVRGTDALPRALKGSMSASCGAANAVCCTGL